MPSVPRISPRPEWGPPDHRGRPIRADPCSAVPIILDKASERVRNSLGEDTNPSELIRSAAIQLSRYLDRAGARAHSRNTQLLLMVCFQRRLQRCALRLVRRQIVTDASPYGRRVLEDDSRSKVAPISHCEHDKDKAQGRRWPKRASDLV